MHLSSVSLLHHRPRYKQHCKREAGHFSVIMGVKVSTVCHKWHPYCHKWHPYCQGANTMNVVAPWQKCRSADERWVFSVCNRESLVVVWSSSQKHQYGECYFMFSIILCALRVQYRIEVALTLHAGIWAIQARHGVITGVMNPSCLVSLWPVGCNWCHRFRVTSVHWLQNQHFETPEGFALKSAFKSGHFKCI